MCRGLLEMKMVMSDYLKTRNISHSVKSIV